MKTIRAINFGTTVIGDGEIPSVKPFQILASVKALR